MPKFVSYIEQDAGGNVLVVSEDEFKLLTTEQKSKWDEWVWQEQPTKEDAYARHDEAFSEWREDADAQRKIKDYY